jgi:predicted nucleic acid-binding protein
MVVAALLDSNVVIAAIVADHMHHTASGDLLSSGNPREFGVAAHSYAEAYVALTREGRAGGIAFPPDQAWAALEGMRTITTLLGVTAAQTLDAVGRFAARRGIGPRLYDALIGEVAAANGIPAIVTWNIRHMSGLFPMLNVMAPPAFLGSRQRPSPR